MLLTSWLRSLRTNRFRKHAPLRKATQKRNRLHQHRFSSQTEHLEDRTLLTALIFESQDMGGGSGLQIDNSLMIGTGTAFSPEFDSVVIESVNTDSAGIDITLSNLFLNTIVIDTVNITDGGTVNINLNNISGLQAITLDNLNIADTSTQSVVIRINDMVVDDVSVFGSSFSGLDFVLFDSSAFDSVDTQVNNLLISKSTLSDVDVILDGTTILNGRIVENTLLGSTDSEALSLILINGSNADGFAVNNNIELGGVSFNVIASSFDNVQVSGNTISGPVGVEGLSLALRNGATADNFTIAENLAIESITEDAVHFDLKGTPIDGLTIRDNLFSRGISTGVDFLIDGDTFSQPFAITNTSGFGQRLIRFRIDIEPSGLEFDPTPETGQPFTPVNGTETVTGLIEPVIVEDRSTVLDMRFTDFSRDETFEWLLDLDRAGLDTSVLGNELIGSTVVLNFSDGTQLTGIMVGVPNNPDASRLAIAQGGSGGDGVDFDLDNADLTNLNVSGNFLEGNADSGFRFTAFHSNIDGEIVGNELNLMDDHGIDFDLISSNFSGAIFQNTIGGNGGNAINFAPRVEHSGQVLGASNTDPIRVTSFLHGLTSGDVVTIVGVEGNEAANGTHIVNVISVHVFELFDDQGDPIEGDGLYLGGGTWFETQDAILIDLQSSSSKGLAGNILSANMGSGVFVDLPVGTTFNANFTQNIIDNNQDIGFAMIATDSVFDLNIGSVNPEDGNLFNRNVNAGIAFDINDTTVGSFEIRNNEIIATQGDFATPPEIPKLRYDIDLNFLGGLSDSQIAAFDVAASRWEEIIIGDLPDVGLIDDILIDFEAVVIDGPGGILGQAGPRGFRGPPLFHPFSGIIQMDIADVDDLEASGLLLDVILHEMAHVIGFGFLWDARFQDQVRGSGGNDPRFIGVQATAEYNQIFGNTEPDVPIEVGTEGHWREDPFDNELMTPFIGAGVNPISRVTVALWADHGYVVDISAADPFFPLGGGGGGGGGDGGGGGGDPPPSNLVLPPGANLVGDGINITLEGTDPTADGKPQLIRSIIDGNTIGKDAQGNTGRGIAFFMQERAVIDDLVISNNRFINNGDNGFEFSRRDDAVLNAVIVEFNSFQGNVRNGIDLFAKHTTVDLLDFQLTENDITLNGSMGINVRVEAEARIEANFDLNVIDRNGGNGIQFGGFQQVDIIANLTENVVRNNGQNGIRNVGDGTMSLIGIWTDNLIETNETEGVSISGAVFGDMTWNRNLILANGGDGVQFLGPAGIFVQWNGNTVADNDGHGVFIDSVNQDDGGIRFILGDLDPVNINVISGNDGDGIRIYGSRNYLDSRNNIIVNNTGKGVDIQANMGFLRDNFTDQQISRFLFKETTISGNGNDGIEFLAEAHSVLLDIRNSFIRFNGGRGVDILHRSFENVVPVFTQAFIEIHDTVINSNDHSGIYVVNTTDNNQTQNSTNDALTSGGHWASAPYMSFRMTGNIIESNGSIDAGIPGGSTLGGLVFHVGTAHSTNSNQASREFAARIRAEIVDNAFAGNFGAEVFIDNYTSTIDPPVTTGIWPPIPEPVPPEITFLARDPLARMDIVFRGNSGNTLDVINGDSWYNNPEEDFKSRQHTKNPPGPFSDHPDHLGIRPRNATRLPDFPQQEFDFDGLGDSTLRVESDWETDNFTLKQGFGFSDFDSFWLGTPAPVYIWDEFQLQPGSVFGAPVLPDIFDSAGLLNDAWFDASDLGELGSITLTNLNIDVPMEEDWFQFTVTQPGLVRVTTSGTDDLDLAFVDSEGRTLDRGVTFGTSEQVAAFAEPGRTYYVRAYPAGGTTVGNYSLTINAPFIVDPDPPVDPPPDPPSDPPDMPVLGDGPETETPLPLDGPIVVDYFAADSHDADTFDGVAADAGGNTSLRAAIMQANASPNGEGPDVIQIEAGTVTFGQIGQDENNAMFGDLDITDDLIIMGAGIGETFIDAKDLDRIFHILPGVNVAISGMSIMNGTEGHGGAIFNQGSLDLSEVWILNNDATVQGGAIYNEGALNLNNATLDGNFADSRGGGLFNAGGTVVVENSTISNNTASSRGGGIFNEGDMRIFNSTVSGNSTVTNGGGIFNNGDLEVFNVTVTLNHTSVAGGGIANDPTAVIQVANTIVAENTSDDSNSDVFGSFGSLGSNFIGDIGDTESTEGFIDGVIGDQVGGNGNSVIDPGLSPLGDFGGFSRTHFPDTDSPVRDRGSNTVATEFDTDQRGNVRIFDGDDDGFAIVDIGAVEAAEISHGGLVFEDTNGDGIRQQTETGKSDVEISLFSAGTDGAFGGGDDVLLGITQTDANGLYLFEDIIPGKFYLSLDVPTGFDLSPQDQGGDNSVDSDFNPVTGRTPIFPLSGSFLDEAQDAGLVPQPASFGDFVFSDLDENGLQVIGEPGIEGIVISLFSPGADGQIGGGDDVLLATTTTNINGIYGFGGLVAGDYYLSFGAKVDFAITQKDVGNDDSLDSDVEPTTGLTDLFSLVPGQNNTSVDAGYVPGAKVGNLAWLDSNLDGIKQGIEAGVANVLVELFTAGADGQIGGGDDLPAGITTTDSSGFYQFQDLLSGEYYIQFTTPTALAITLKDQGVNDNSDSDVNPFTGLTDVFTLFTGQDEDSIDVGLINEARVGNFVWKDDNRNGIQDAGEPGLSGLEVIIHTAGADGEIGGGDDILLQTTTTDGQGQYTFGNLPPGQYYVEFEEPATLNFTEPDVLPGPGGNDNIDSDVDPQSGLTDVFTLSAGQFDQSIDAGLVDESLIGDFVFRDLNNDGLQQISEPGVEGAQITLFSPGADELIGGGDDTELATTFSDSNGRYLFDELDAGFYYVKFAAPAGLALTSQFEGNNRAVDSDPNPQSGFTPIFELGDGQFLDTVDAGLVTGATIGDFVWFDENQDGRQQVAENGAENVLVNLFITGTDGVIGGGDDIFIASTTTNLNGRYSFVDLPADRYYLTFGEPDQFIFTLPNQGVNDLADSDVDFSGLTDAFDIAIGQVDVSRDAGLIPHSDARIGNFAFRDINGDGLQQAEDFGFAGLHVTIFNAGGDGKIGGADDIFVKTTTTNAKGRYVFNNLAPGAYFVGFETPVNITFSQQFADGGDDESAIDSNVDPFTGLTNVFILTSGENDQTIDAGLIDDTSVGDFVWRDTSRDGIRQGDELGLPGVIVEIFTTGPDGQIGGGDDTLVATTTTDDNGEYLFANLTPGDYYLQFTSPNFDLDFTLQDQGENDTADSDVDPETGRTEILVLNAGTNLTSVDAGMIDVTRVGNLVWRDTSGDGIQQENEPGEEGVEVILFSTGDDGVFGGGDDVEVASTLTDSNGNFMFRRFDEGNYYLLFVAPPGLQFTSLTQGSDDNLDSNADPTTGRTDVFNMVEGQADVTRDAGLVSQTSTPMPPDVPVLTGPPPSTDDTTPLFTWNAANGAETYQLLVYNVALGREVINQSGLVGTSFESTTVTLVPGTHSAYLRATNAFGTSNFSSPHFFDVNPSDSSAPGPPTLTGPASPTSDTTPTFTWDAVSGADTYELLVYHVAQGREVIHRSGIVGTSYTDSTILQSGEHQAFLRATNGFGTSVWSVAYFFTVEAGVQQGPGTPSFTSPADGSEVNDLTPTFTWTTAASAVTYELLIYDFHAGQQVRNIQGISTTSFTLTNPLTQGRNYQAFVRALNSTGPGAWSTPIRFTVVSADVENLERNTEDLIDSVPVPNFEIPLEEELPIVETRQELIATLTTRQFDPTIGVYGEAVESSAPMKGLSVAADDRSIASSDEIDSILSDWNEVEWWQDDRSETRITEGPELAESHGSVKAAISSGLAALGLKGFLNNRRRENKRLQK